MYLCMYACTCVRVCTYMHSMFIYVCMYIDIYLYTTLYVVYNFLVLEQNGSTRMLGVCCCVVEECDCKCYYCKVAKIC